MTKKAPVTLKTSINLLTLSVFLGLLSATAVANNNTNAVNQTLVANTNANPKTPDGKEVRSSDQPAQFNEVANKQAREYLTKYGRPPNIPLIPLASMKTYDGDKYAQYYVSYLQGVWRTVSSGNHYHGGHDFSSKLGQSPAIRNKPMYSTVTGEVVLRSENSLIVKRAENNDRVAHLHSNQNLIKGQRLVGGKLQNPTTYGTPILSKGTLFARVADRGAGKGSHHDHMEYHVLPNDARTKVTIYRNKGILTSRANTAIARQTEARSTKYIGGYKQIEPSPYFAYDVYADDSEHRGQAYAGKSVFSNFNNIYNTQLPAGLFEPDRMGVQSQLTRLPPPKKLPKTYFTQSAFANMDISMEQLGSANMAIVDYATNAENAGFDVQGQLITQKMLVSHMSDENGETWQSVFGTAESVNPHEMNQADLIRHLANKRLGNDEWYSKIITLSDKGVFMEFMAQRAEINFMYGLLTKLKQEQIKQDAILASVMMNHKDKAVTDLGEIINASVAPDFASVQLEKKGDEWAIDEVYVGGSVGGDGFSGDSGAGIDIANLPDDLQALSRALLEAISGHESHGSYNAWNKGTECKGNYLQKTPHPYAPIIQMTPAQILTRYYGVPYKNTSDGVSNAVGCSKRLFAVGKYQWIPITLNDMIKRSAFKQYLHQPFTAEVQDKVAPEYFFKYKRPAVGNFIQTGKGLYEAKIAIAHEWASIAVPQGGKRAKGYSRGCSPTFCDTYYNAKAGNKAFYGSTMKVWAILEKIEQVHKQKGSQ